VKSAVRRQRGYTLVETIVAIAVGAIVMAAIFPIFLLLYRVETTWGDATQARATGLIAEDSLVRDLRAYYLSSKLDPQVPVSENHPLILTSLATDGSTYQIDYYVKKSRCTPPPWPHCEWDLIRTVTQHDITISKVTVAHGIGQVTAKCLSDGAEIELQISTVGTAGTGVNLDPNLVITTRNQQRCPP
jgi:prepilin-type N-terminal cleavage/methylation domain-containing protein